MNLKKQKQKWLAFLCSLLLLLSSFGSGQAEVVSAVLTKAAGTLDGMVRVYLSSIAAKTTLNVTVNGSYSINGNVNQPMASGEGIKIALNTSNGNITMTRNGQSISMGTSFQLRRHSAGQSGGLIVAESLNASNPYPGDMLFTAQKSGSAYKLYAIANVFIEDYLYGVVPYEMGNSAQLEALKAQAVAARTYTLNKMNVRATALYDVVDTTNDQVYRGTPTGNANCVAAVDGTRGIVAMVGNSLVETYYTASNGGQTESSLNAWGTSRSYLIVKDDPFDYANSDSQVKKTTVYTDFSNANQNSALKALLTNKAKTAASVLGYDSSSLSIQKITSVVPHTPKYSAPSAMYTFIDFFVTAQAKKGGSANAVSISLQLTCNVFSELESALGMSINGTANELWSVKKSGDVFSLEARRFGHGIGLSQRGAMQMGRLGYTYSEILGFYYTGSKRMQYTFLNTILSPISTGDSTSIVIPVDPADLTDEDAPCTAIVSLVDKKGSLGIYSAASTGAGMLGAAPNGAPVRVLAIDGAWCFIGYGQVYGYAQKSGLIITGTAPAITNEQPSIITEYAVVDANGYLNLRQSGAANAPILGTAPDGAILSVFSKENGWAYIQYGSLTAYASTNFLTFYASYPTAVSNPDENLATVTLSDAAQTVNMRKSASLNAEILNTLNNGTQVTVIQNDGSWCQVVYHGQTGYIMTGYLVVAGISSHTPTPAPQEPQTLSATVQAAGEGSLVYKEGNALAEVIGNIQNGATVSIDEYGMAWCKVRHGELDGYVKTAELNFAGGGSATVYEKATVFTQSGSLNLRSKASAGGMILCTVPRLAVINVLEKGDTWCYVDHNGVTGYVMRMYLVFEGEAPTETSTPTPIAPPEQSFSARVTTASGSLNLRRSASSEAEVLTTIPRDTTISVFEKGAVWCQTVHNGISGYVMTSFLVFLDAESAPAPNPTTTPETTDMPAPAPSESAQPQALFGTVTTTSGSLNLRLEATSAAGILCVIPRGTKLEIRGKQESWSQVSYLGHEGYVMNAYLTFSTEAASDVPLNNNGQIATVTTASGGLNLRTNPSVGNNVLVSIPRLAQINVYERGTKWCYVEYGGFYGYVMTSYLSFGESTQAPLPEGGETAYVSTGNGGGLNLRDSAGGKVIGAIPNGAQIAVLKKGETWTNVNYAEMNGYVMTSYLVFGSAPPIQDVPAPEQTATSVPTPVSAPTPEPTATPLPLMDATMHEVQGETYAMIDPALEWVGIYKECSVQAEPIAKVVSEQVLTLLMVGDNWCKVQVGNIQGYCIASVLMMPE